MHGVLPLLNSLGLGAAVICISKRKRAGLKDEGTTHNLSHCLVQCPTAAKVPKLYRFESVLSKLTGCK